MRHTRHRRRCAYCPRKAPREQLQDGVCFECRVAQRALPAAPPDPPCVAAIKAAWAVQDKRNRHFAGARRG